MIVHSFGQLEPSDKGSSVDAKNVKGSYDETIVIDKAGATEAVEPTWQFIQGHRISGFPKEISDCRVMEKIVMLLAGFIDGFQEDTRIDFKKSAYFM